MQAAKLLRVELRDFKSFSGEHVIGPFSKFSGIVGPNGSGKSNILDALAFCLFLDPTPRSENYVHKGQNEEESASSCAVRVTVEDGEGHEHTFERQFGADDHFFVDGEVAEDQDAYIEAVRRAGILPLSFVKQNEVDEIARKSPMELTQFLEEMSGSAEFAARYDKLKLKSESRQEAVNLLDKRRRAAINEKRHIGARVDEATRYRELSAEETRVMLESSLFQLYHTNEKVKATSKELQEKRNELNDLQSQTKNIGLKLQILQRQENDTSAKLAATTKELTEMENKLKEMNAERVMKEEACRRLKESIATAENAITSNERAAKDRESNIEQMTRECEQIEAELAAMPQAEDLEKLILEYETLRDQSNRQFSEQTKELKLAVQERTAAKETLDDLLRQKKNLEATKERSEEMLRNTSEELAKAKQKLQRVTKEVTDALDERKVLQLSKERDEHDQEKLLEQKRKLDNEYDDIKRTTKADKRREQLNNAISQMRWISGVYGRFLDLVRPVNKKYNTAVVVGCGELADAIIVKDREVSKKCIKFLREKQSSFSAQFLPLSALAVTKKPVSIKGAIPLSDALQYDKMFKPAVDYVCGSKQVCETLKQAINISRSHKVRVITYNGDIVGGAVLTGGTTGERPVLNDISGIENELKEIEARLDKLGEQIEKNASDIQAIDEKLMSLEPQKSQLEQRVSDLSHKVKVREVDIRSTERAIKEKTSDIAKAEKDLEEKELRVQTVDLKVSATDEKVFAEFCKKAGVTDIRQFEVTRLQDYEERYAKRLQLQGRLAQLRDQIAAETRRDPMKANERIAGEKENNEHEYQASKQRLAELQQESADLKVQVEAVRKTWNSLRDEDKAHNEKLQQKRRKLRQRNDDLAQANDLITSVEHEHETASQTLSSILQQCDISNIQIPYLEEPEMPIENTPSSFSQIQLDKNKADKINFKAVLSAAKMYIHGDQIDREIRKYEDELAKIRSELSQIRPDLKSDQRIQDVEKELKEMEDKQEALRKKATSAKRKFAEVKQKRRDRFMALYDALDSSIDRVYKRLTRMRDQPNRSGTAYLALEDTEEPYLGGVKFTAMPPHKRFRDLEQLSGGEKAIASLALIIALQKHLKAPFILMDEPDASLDKLNLRSAASALRALSDDSQILSVSLRDRFFEHADILVGVYRDDEDSSGVATLDLTSSTTTSLTMEV